MLSAVLGSHFAMMMGMSVMAVCHMRVVMGLMMMAFFMRLGSFAVMLGSVLEVFGRLQMMFVN